MKPRPRSDRHAPGSYCLTTCLCGEHPDYRPAPAPTFKAVGQKQKYDPTTDRSWDDPEED